jgi:hypothetical protein
VKCILGGILNKAAIASLTKLKEWWVMTDAAQHLSQVSGIEITEAALLQFALAGHLKLSLHLVNGVAARKLVRVKDAEGEEYPADINKMFPNYPLGDKGRLSPFVRKSGSDGARFLNLESNVTTIKGVWDLPLIGGERFGVEHELHRLLSLPNVNLPDLNNVLVERHDGEMWLLQERYGDIESRKGSNAQLTKMRQYIADNNIGDEEALELNNQYSEARKKFNARKWGEDTTYIPDWLPEDAILVIRKQAMMEFEQHIRDNQPENSAITQTSIKQLSLKRSAKFNDCVIQVITEFIEINGYPPNSIGEVIGRMKHQPPDDFDIVFEKATVSMQGEYGEFYPIDKLERAIKRQLGKLKQLVVSHNETQG